MKTLYLFFILSIFFIFNFSFICISSDSVTINKKVEVERISKLIDNFNANNLSEIKKIILTKFQKISKEQLDTLIIFSEPVFEVNPNCKEQITYKKDSLGDIKYVLLNDWTIYYLKPDSNNQTVYSCITLPNLIIDSVRISVRLYNHRSIQEYFIQILDPSYWQSTSTCIASTENGQML